MSPLVALKMEGRFAGAILTVLSLPEVRIEKECQGYGGRFMILFSSAEAAAAGGTMRFSHTKSIS